MTDKNPNKSPKYSANNEVSDALNKVADGVCELQKGDQVLVSVSKISREGVTIKPPQWSNISDIDPVSNFSQVEISSGSVAVEIEKIRDDTAVVRAIRGKYEKHTWPGDSTRCWIDEPVAGPFLAASTDNTQLDELYVKETTPGSCVSAQVFFIRDGVGLATASETHSSGIHIGDHLSAEMIPRSRKAMLDEITIPVFTDEYAHTSAQVTIEITGITPRIEGNVRNDSKLLTEGDQFTTGVSQGESTIQFNEATIQLDSECQVSGPATIELQDVTAGSVRGTVHSYECEPPTEGAMFYADMPKGSKQATLELSEESHISVELEHAVPVGGKIKVKIVDRKDGSFDGKVLEYVGYDLLESGVQVRAIVRTGSKKAIPKPDRFPCNIRLKKKPQSSGTAVVKVQRVTNRVYGTIVSDVETSDRLDGDGTDKTPDMTNLSKL